MSWAFQEAMGPCETSPLSGFELRFRLCTKQIREQRRFPTCNGAVHRDVTIAA